jgi:hypothetical protein
MPNTSDTIPLRDFDIASFNKLLGISSGQDRSLDERRFARGLQPFSAAETQTIRDACRLDASDGHPGSLPDNQEKCGGDLAREMHGLPSSEELPACSWHGSDCA